MKEKAKSCPFCGGEPRPLHCIPYIVGKGRVLDMSIECSKCFASIGTKHETYEEALKEWNRRV